MNSINKYTIIAFFTGLLIGVAIMYRWNRDRPVEAVKDVESRMQEVRDSLEMVYAFREDSIKLLQKKDTVFIIQENDLKKTHVRLREKGISRFQSDSLLNSMLSRGKKRFDIPNSN